jgi:hypothetical protein
MQMAKSPRSLTPASSRVPGWANGNIEPYEFTDIDRTVAAGLSLRARGGAGRTTLSDLPASSMALGIDTPKAVF